LKATSLGFKITGWWRKGDMRSPDTSLSIAWTKNFEGKKEVRHLWAGCRGIARYALERGLWDDTLSHPARFLSPGLIQKTHGPLLCTIMSPFTFNSISFHHSPLSCLLFHSRIFLFI
jgi:hypothetical protein